MDVILAPSLFVRDAVLADLPDATVIHYPQTVFLPEGVRPTGSASASPPTRSSSSRASRWPATSSERTRGVRSRRFGERSATTAQAVLALKVNSDVTGHGAGMKRLRAIAAATPGVVLLEKPMSYVEVLSLYASCDVLVSLHRSEGLGLNMLEAMSLGVPVLATGWSGNMDFMTP